MLLGQITDTNSVYISRQLASLGVDLYYHSTAGDNLEHLTTALKVALNRSNLIITTGGLGPTKDDLTRKAVARAFDLELVLHQPSLEAIIELFDSYQQEMTPNNRRQAFLPQGARVIPNPVGTAPGFLVESDEATIISLPGVPQEMKAMVTESLIPYLRQIHRSKLGLFSRLLKVYSLGESTLEDRIEDILQSQSNPTIALLADKDGVKIRLTAKASDEDEARKLIDPWEKRIRSRLEDNIYALNEERMEDTVLKLLQERELTLSLAESCTGGLIAHRITNVPGASSVLKAGLVTYTYQAKEKILGLAPELLRERGAVNKEVVAEMAENVRQLTGSNLSLATSGIAGPGGGGEGKPVGLVYFALSSTDFERVVSNKFRGQREEIKEQAAQKGLDLLRRYLL